jgi:carboxylesterase
MPQFPWLEPKPFFLPAGRVGCLLIHGFTGSPPEMRPLGEYLVARGVTVSGPLLPGHGTTPQDLAATTWKQWYGCVEQAYQDLSERCSEVFVGGFSLGTLLAAHLAANHTLPGLVLMSPAFWLRDRRTALVPLLRHVIRSVAKDIDPKHSDLADPEAYKRFWSYDVHPTAAIHQLLLLQKLARADLPNIQAPTLVIYAVRDTELGHSGPATYAQLGAKDKEQMVMQKSGHGLVVDSECEIVFQRVFEWIAAHRLPGNGA